MISYFKNSKIYSWIALVAILFGDVFALIAKFSNLHIWYYSLIGSFMFLVLLWAIGNLNNVRFNFRSIILSNLLSNVAAPRPLCVLYLLCFILHIGWLGNIFASSQDILLSLVICISLIFFIILFFPSRQENKNSNATKVFVSGISQVNFANLNLVPIVRMLNLTNNDEACKMIIIHSNYYDKYYSTDDEDKDRNKITDNINKYFQEYYDKAFEIIKDVKEIVKIYEDAKNGTDVVPKLKLIIRILAFGEFREKKWILDPKKFEIEFTEAQDYNNFSNCFNAITEKIDAEDNSSHVLYFNLTPGTANISALMTLMAIDGDRFLYYYVPENDPQKVNKLSEQEKNLRLVKVNKKDIPLHNLLSQAIETLNK